MGKLDAKVALLFGGAPRQGRSHAVRPASEGAQIIVCDIAERVEFVPSSPEHYDKQPRTALWRSCRDPTPWTRI